MMKQSATHLNVNINNAIQEEEGSVIDVRKHETLFSVLHQHTKRSHGFRGFLGEQEDGLAN